MIVPEPAATGQLPGALRFARFWVLADNKWWIFAEPRPAMRRALRGLKRFIVTPYTAKFRPFVFVEAGTMPDAMAYAVASDDAYVLGVLSSRVHVRWAMSAGGRLGVGNDPRYTSNTTFAPFPFPDASPAQKDKIRRIAERLDQHRKDRQAEHPKLTLTAMYNVLERIRPGVALIGKEKVTYDEGLVGLLRKLHDELDAAVLEAYGWQADLADDEVIKRLISLNADRAVEEEAGTVRWVRADLKTSAAQIASPALSHSEEPTEATPGLRPWPTRLAEQITAVRRVLGRTAAMSSEEIATAFEEADIGAVESVLESLVALGLAVAIDEDGDTVWKGSDRLASGRPPPLTETKTG